MNEKTQSLSADYSGWRTVVSQYQQPDARIAIWQVINSFGGLFLCWILMYFSLNIGYWLTLLLSIPAAGFLVRIFIIQHDCGHGSFFKSRRANDTVGIVCSLFTLVAYVYWRKSHAVHHANHAKLDDRGVGDIWTMTVEEYNQASSWKQLTYRVFRNPFFLFGIAPVVNFVILGRFPLGVRKNWRNGEISSVLWTNLALAGLLAASSALVGFTTVIAIQLPIMVIASSVGTWLFYVQHQYEHMYWERTPQWDYILAAMHGSSYYQLPLVLQWFTGNIGFHHIHHLSPRIPNYNLSKCHRENPDMQRVVHLTLRSSLETVTLALWDEEQRQLVTFRDALLAKKAVQPSG